MNLLNNFKHLFIIIILIIALFTGFYAIANTNSLVLVYPKNNATINANSTFLIGHTHPKAVLTINDEKVKVYDNGAFVVVQNLRKGKNYISLKSYINDDMKTQIISLYVPVKSARKKLIQPVFKPLDETLVVIEDEAALRVSPYGDRLTPTKKGVIFKTIGYINHHYKVLLSNEKYAYIGESTVKKCLKSKIAKQTLNKISFVGKEKDIDILIPVEQPVPVEITNQENILKVKLHGTVLNFKDYIVKSPYVNNFSFDGDTFNISIATDKLNGYDYFYDDKTLVLRIRKPFSASLYGKTIAIDAGHGGSECGSIGPTEVPEKDINLAISKYLKEELEKNGAKVIMTREDDSFIDLYERVKIAQNADADVLISIHNNALPDGQNPYKTHGTTTYYYNPQATKLAAIMQKNLLRETGFPDLGVKKASFVLTRPTMPISLLLEVGFMINPIEYEKLLSEKNQKSYAIGICNGLKEYFK